MTSTTTTTEVLSNDGAHGGVISTETHSTTMMHESFIDNGQQKMLTMQYLEQISNNSYDHFDDDESADETIQDNCKDKEANEAEDDAQCAVIDDETAEQVDAEVMDDDSAQDADIYNETTETTEEDTDVADATNADSGEQIDVEPDVKDDSDEAVEEAVEDAVIYVLTDEDIPDEATEDAAIPDETTDESGGNGADKIDDVVVDDDKNNIEKENAKRVDISGETIGDDAPALKAKDDCVADDAPSDDTNDVVADKDVVIVHDEAAAQDSDEDAVVDDIVENCVEDIVIDDGEAEDTSNEDIAVEADVAKDEPEENQVADEVDEDADDDSVEDDDVDENKLSLEEFVTSFVFTFDEDERGFSETDGPTFDDEEETYSDEDVTYLSDENDELKLIRDSYSLYKRTGKIVDPEASCYTKKKKDDLLDEACAAIDRFYWRLTSLFIKTKKTVQESAKKGKAVAEENINSERWSKEINEAQKAKEAFLKSFHQCTAMGYDINASDGNTVGIKESFSTASDDDKTSKELRAGNTKKLYEKDCKHFANFAGMSSKEANDFFESAHPSVIDFHNQFIGPCMPLQENAPNGAQSQKLSQWLNSAKSGSNKSKVIDSVPILQGLVNEKSGNKPWDESSHLDEKQEDSASPESLEQAEESKRGITESEKDVCESEESDTTIASEPEKSVLENNGTDELNNGGIESNQEKETMESSARSPSTKSGAPENREPPSPTVKAKKIKKQRFWIPGRSKKTEEPKKSEESRRLSSIILIKSDAIEAATPNEDFLKIIAANTKKMRRKKRNSKNSTAASSFILSAGDTGCEVLM